MIKMYSVYILTTNGHSVLYVGITNDLKRRIIEHRNESLDGFTKRYHVKKLVYYEEYSSAVDAISREKQLKRWTREKKNALIESKNPNWDDWAKMI